MLKKIGFIVLIIIVLSTLCFGEVKKVVKQSMLKTQKDKFSYSIGYDIGKNIKAQELDVDPKLLLKGLTDALSGIKSQLTDTEKQELMTAVQNEMMTKRADRLSKLAIQNKKDGEAFLAANKTKEGVVTLASGLQYKELKAGTGSSPTANDTVKVHYRGTLINGTEFDSSYKREEPAIFPVSGVIPGWTEALQLMKVGAKWQLFIPANLAYGENGAGPDIGPNATIIFEVELLSIEPKK